MDFNEFQTKSVQRAGEQVRNEPNHALLCAALGIAGEGGEYADTIKKIVYHDHPIDEKTVEHMMLELGDVLWYVALAAHGLGVPLETLALMNVAKLEQRYPNGFDPVVSKARSQTTPEPPQLEWTYEPKLDRYMCVLGDYYCTVVQYPNSVMLYVLKKEDDKAPLLEEGRFRTLEEAKARGERVLTMRAEADEAGIRG
jgi:NTP pyrophosphatase (non-canonical NTP hydrolase)